MNTKLFNGLISVLESFGFIRVDTRRTSKFRCYKWVLIKDEEKTVYIKLWVFKMGKDDYVIEVDTYMTVKDPYSHESIYNCIETRNDVPALLKAIADVKEFVLQNYSNKEVQ